MYENQYTYTRHMIMTTWQSSTSRLHSFYIEGSSRSHYIQNNCFYPLNTTSWNRRCTAFLKPVQIPGKELMKEHTCSTLHCEGLESRTQSELLQLSSLLCSLSLSCSFSLSACKRSLVVIGPGESSSLSIHIELDTLWLSLERWESCSCWGNNLL